MVLRRSEAQEGSKDPEQRASEQHSCAYLNEEEKEKLYYFASEISPFFMIY